MGTAVRNSNPYLSDGWLKYAAMPVLPFILGVGILQFAAPPQLGGISSSESPQKLTADSLRQMEVTATGKKVIAFAHLGDQFSYLAAVLLQVITCAIVIVVQARFLTRLKEDVRRRAINVLIVTLFMAMGIYVTIHVTRAPTYQLSYHTIRQLLLLSPGWPAQFANDGADGILFSHSRLFYSAIVPFALGSAAVAMTAASGAAIASRDERTGEDWESEFSTRLTQLQTLCRMSTAVLVATAFASMLFFQLPVGLMDAATAPAISKFAKGITVYWGSIMTLTLAAVFVMPVMSLLREARSHYDRTTSDQTFTEWLNERGNLSVKKHIAHVAQLLAPVLVGPVGTLMQSMFGA